MAVTVTPPLPASQPPEREIRRNFLIGLLNGGMFSFAETLIDPPLVLAWFVSRLTSSNLLIGMISPIGDAGWFLPQVLLAGRIQRMPRKMPMYIAGAVLRTAAWIALTAAVVIISLFANFGRTPIASNKHESVGPVASAPGPTPQPTATE